ncbi:MAG: ATPase, BadF/BadG/BcrA/BcrD type [candidate division CPR2 bacterium GW2011_GWC1_39_9]|uniref:ATPase, BadF/BadG/BcrA/BcrD type n=1 Tax=candidate division CPR2 bacterium GW2011_GWC2_39_10 TaxID=1618345 RepID=A0A0G0M570_UNCC2|nr:MAG: ATPase, BadF/BadG/BcrA/BcrD type [candidate division CPR2 bacterium GW2011_GWC2_39_10]KKR36211.1 MAG: ATPase, BadF/BadG/BcrA/BcrD type [candidate division CPR2 bacterium GW2011_GWC1_39_9]
MLTTLKSGLYLGIDTGATRTEATITKETGLVIGIGEAGTANLHNVSIETAFNNIKVAVEEAKKDLKSKQPETSINEFEAACLGISGLDTVADKERLKTFFNGLTGDDQTLGSKILIIANNGLTGLMSGTENPYGICLIAATGSNCYGVSKTGRETSSGNWGYFLGDQGSAFAIGQALLRLAMKEFDGRLPQTAITHKILDYLNLADAGQIVGWAYRETLPVREIAGLSKLIDDDDLSNIVDIAEITNQTVRELINAYRAVIDRLEIDLTNPFPVVLVGGLFSMKNNFIEKVESSILGITPQAAVVKNQRSISEGAARIAMLHNYMRLFPESLIVIVRPS